MRDYSLELAGKKFPSKSTGDYFEEVISSYHNGNYRAAIVTLYSVVLCDLLAKLETLEEIYDDKVAIDLLKDIRKYQKENPTKSEWENSLIKDIKQKTNLLDNVDYAHINSLKQLRHLCAHPVLNKENKLYTPNKETVGSHIRNMMESVLTKPAILSKKILSTILVDIGQKKEILIDNNTLENYLKSKYLQNLTPQTEVSLFRDLWKIVFRLDNEEANNNRGINYRTLYILYKRNTDACIKKIKGEKEYFSNIGTEVKIDFLIWFLAESEFLFNELTEEVRLIINQRIKFNTDAKVVAWFVSKSYLEHLEEIKAIEQDYINRAKYKTISSRARQLFFDVGIVKGYISEVVEYTSWRYSKSINFNDADKTFSYCLEPYLKYFNKEQVIELCRELEKNNQTYERKRAEEDHERLFKVCKEKVGIDFEKKMFPKTFGVEEASHENINPKE